MQVGVERYLSVTVSRKTKSGFLELGTQLLVVEDFPVKNECHIAIRTLHRLIPSFKVDYSKPCGAE
jgi:hypothetical protein